MANYVDMVLRTLFCLVVLALTACSGTMNRLSPGEARTVRFVMVEPLRVYFAPTVPRTSFDQRKLKRLSVSYRQEVIKGVQKVYSLANSQSYNVMSLEGKIIDVVPGQGGAKDLSVSRATLGVSLIDSMTGQTVDAFNLKLPQDNLSQTITSRLLTLRTKIGGKFSIPNPEAPSPYGF